MTRLSSLAALFLSLAVLLEGCSPASTAAPVPAPISVAQQAIDPPPMVTNQRQLIFNATRSGEAYFHPDGNTLVMQAEVDAANPFYQIYTFSLRDGERELVSTGTGKTTCSYFHPNGKTLLYASTHLDPESQAHQKAELDFRKSGKERRYSWDYDPSFDIFSRSEKGADLRRLTTERGYDAEGAYSPKGDLIVFASNRDAYNRSLSEDEARRLKDDPAYFIDIYTMKPDGTEVKQLTTTEGYDGGPFFDSTGELITWRRFTPDGSKAEIWMMNADGSNPRQVTEQNVMSWAPFFHPSGEYIIYTSNQYGYGNFELFVVSTRGDGKPIRVTSQDGFDGLPVFSPDGTKLVWSSTRTHTKKAQVFMADWNHSAAMAAIGRVDSGAVSRSKTPPGAPQARIETLTDYVSTLASPEFEGRLTGTEGEAKAIHYVANGFKNSGLAPAGDNDSFFEEFKFSSGVSLGKGTRVNLLRGEAVTTQSLEVDYLPLAFSKTGQVQASPIAFAGYGISAPKGPDGQSSYTSYKSKSVKGKWVIIFRGLPSDLSSSDRVHLGQFSGLRYKAIVASERGAAGLLVAASPTVPVKSDILPLSQARSYGASPIPIISISSDFAMRLLGKDAAGFKALASDLEGKTSMEPSDLDNISLEAQIDLTFGEATGRNVLGRLHVGPEPTKKVVMLGAHIDHLGRGQGGNSLARGEETDQLHLGADDNASGVAAMMEIAVQLGEAIKSGSLRLKHDVVFAAWSGEELGILGSNHHVNAKLPHPHASLGDHVVAYLNMDMIGRFRDKLVLQGLGSSSVWLPMIERANLRTQLPIVIQNDTYLPTDATSFYLKKVPILSAFTGAHSEYHTPRDTIDKVNFAGLARITSLMSEIVIETASLEESPDYITHKRKGGTRRGGAMKIYMGTIPDYATQGLEGVKFSGATPGSPAEKAGIQAGDIMVQLADKEMNNIYDFVYMLGVLKPGEEVPLVVIRDGQRMVLKITPTLKD
ncbi:MAG: M28 family peptidase [Myxococcota bacterium]|nr:M28 family peptidase [Myxococcota bacterium]